MIDAITIPNLSNWMNEYASSIVFLCGMLILGMIVSIYVTMVIQKILRLLSIDNSISRLALRMLRWLVILIFFMIGLTSFGVDVMSLVALIGALSLAVSLSLQKALSNLATGGMLLLFRPYKLGDTIQSMSHEGVVTHIGFFHTILKAPNGDRIILPNNKVMDQAIIRR